jgi:hypothetical protein
LDKGEYNVILSPELYWVKRVKLPVKKVSAAKKLAESIFEGTLPSGDYAYEVSKSGEEFVIVAYEKDGVSKLLKDKFTKDAKISSVYFAQHEFGELTECCGIDRDSSLINLNGLIMQVPRVCTQSKQEIGAFLKDKKLSNHKVSLGSFENSVISKKEFYLLSAGIAILALSNIIEWVNYNSAVSLLDTQRSEIISKYNLPPTSMQIKSIKSSLSKTFTTQKKIRDEIFSLNSLPLKKDEYIESINANTKQTEIMIKVESQSRESQIKSAISKKVKVKSSQFQDDHLILRISS